MTYTNADSANSGTKSCGIFDGTSSQTGQGCTEIINAEWDSGVDSTAANGRNLDEKWTNEVCRPGNSTYTVLNANCKDGICQCNEHYYASERDGKSSNPCHNDKLISRFLRLLSSSK